MVKINDIEIGIEFNSSNGFDNESYVDIESGNIIFVSDIIDERPPEDLYENEKYVLLPTKQELGLGKPLVLDFISETKNELYDEVYEIFSSRGAYRRFRSFLEHNDLLELWYKFEEKKTHEAIIQWCDERNIPLS